MLVFMNSGADGVIFVLLNINLIILLGNVVTLVITV